MNIIFLWPDGAWVYRDEYEPVLEAWRGDDFEVLTKSDQWCTDHDNYYVGG